MPKRETAAEEVGISSPKKKQKQAVAEDTTESGTPPSVDVKALEATYREALDAFKKDKSDKDLRRAKSAARKAWDEAVAASQDGEQLSCKDCSQRFMFTSAEQDFYSEKGWQHKPTRCPGCNESHKARRTDRSKRDSKDKRMCFAYQRGECKHGGRCKFSHYDSKQDGKGSDGAAADITAPTSSYTGVCLP